MWSVAPPFEPARATPDVRNSAAAASFILFIETSMRGALCTHRTGGERKRIQALPPSLADHLGPPRSAWHHRGSMGTALTPTVPESADAPAPAPGRGALLDRFL